MAKNTNSLTSSRENRDDVRMAELRGGARLPQESVPQALVARVVGRQQLDRHRPIEPHFAGEIHDSHAAAPQLELQRIAPGERGLEVEEEAVGLGGHEAMLPYCRLYRPLPPAFRFPPLCRTTNLTSLQPSRPPSSRRAR